MSADLVAPEAGAPPGLDPERLGDWLTGLWPDVEPSAVTATLLAGGKSNLTYRVRAGARECVVRRPPLGHVLATAHDMAREHRVMSALAGTAVPVPRTYALCADPTVIGAPFYVMAHVPGTPYRTAAQLGTLGAQRTRRISATLVDTLAALHAVEPAAVGLADFGRPDGYLARQLRRWRHQLAASYSRDLPLAAVLHDRLVERLPARPAPPAIVHGDYRLDNVLVDESDRVTAVIDWEMATLGDPLSDLAMLVVYGRLARHASGAAIADAATAPGYLDEAELVKRYAAASRRELPDTGFYLGLAAYKLAGVLEGIHFRDLNGQTTGSGFEGVGSTVPPLLEAGLAYLEEQH